MFEKKTIDFMGVELSRSEIDSYKAWLAEEEGKTHIKVVNALIRTAERKAMSDPQQGQDADLFRMQREQHLGERKAYQRIGNMAGIIEEL